MTVNERIRKGYRHRSLHPPTFLRAAIAVCLLMTSAGCNGPSGRLSAPDGLFWPHSPEVKRIEFVRTVFGPSDLGIRPSMITRVANYLSGKSPSPIIAPYGIATDSTGRLFVVDTRLRRIHVFDAKGNRFNFFPKDETQLVSPVGIAIDHTDTIYITDSKAGVVQVFENGGRKFITTFGKNFFNRPTGIAVHPVTHELLVVDTLQSKVLRFELPGRRPIGSFGSEFAMGDGFYAPTQITVAGNGDIIVADALNFRVLVFNADGDYRFQIGRMGTIPGTFARPKGVAVDSDGNIYVVDALFDNVQVFDQLGRLLMAFGDHGMDPGQFWLPTDIFIDMNDMIYVSDSANHRIQIFRYLKGGQTP